MSHDHTVGRYDRTAEKSNTEIDYPGWRMLRYNRHQNQERHGGSDRRPDDGRARVEPVREQTERVSEQTPSENTGWHEYRPSGRIESAPLREDRAQGEECARRHSTQEGGHQSERRLPIQLSEANPDFPAFLGRRDGLSQSDRHQGDCDNDRDYAEGSEAGRVGRREKELSQDSSQETCHAVDAQNLSPGMFRRGAVEPALDDHEQSGKAEPGQRARRR